jgi:hypothetical protein
MSVLTKSLEKFLFWIENSESSHAHFIRNHPLRRQQVGCEDWYLQPGIEREVIEMYAEQINFKISEEIYELYQWYNGKFVIGDYANDVYFGTFEEGFDRVFNDGYTHFPIFFGDGCYYAVDEANESLTSSPIRLYDGGCEVVSTYAPSLTKLMQAVAECAENYDAISIQLAIGEIDRQRDYLLTDIYRKYGVVGQICGLWR